MFADLAAARIEAEATAIRFEDGIIEMRAAKAKTASRRLVPLLPNLREWLLPHRQASGSVCAFRNMSNEISELVVEMNAARRERDESAVFEWKHNALRHSYISYRLAAIQDTAKVALEAGNSPQMIFQHYRELVRPADAEKWFAVTPESVEAAKSFRTATDVGDKDGRVRCLD